MRVGSEGVGGVPHDARGNRGTEAKGSAYGSAPAGGFMQLLAILQGFASASTVDPADTDEDVDGSAVDSDGAGDGAPAPTGGDAANAAQIAAGVVVTLSSASSGVGAQAGSAAGVAAEQAGSANGVVATNVVALGEAGAGVTVAAPTRDAAAVARGPAVARPSIAANAHGASATGANAAPRGHVVQQGSFALPAGSAPSDATNAGSADKAARGTPAYAPPTSAVIRPRDPISATADSGGSEQGNDNGDDDDAGTGQTGERPPIPGAGKSVVATIECARDGASLSAPPADAARAPRDLGAAAREVRGATNPLPPASEVPRASVASGAVPGLPSWIERLASAQRLGASHKADALRFDLEPNGLGRIEIRLSFGRDGVRAQLFAEHEQTRSLLTNQQAQLAAALERNDLHLESFLVDLGLGSEAGGDARHDPNDVNAFDETGLVSSAAGDESASEVPQPVAGLLSVRA